ncbi:MAG: Na+/H+ antiporter subunit D [Syntrophotaleaceae bacterium]
MMHLITLPLLIPFCTSVLCLICLKSVRLQQLLSILGSAAQLYAALTLLGAVRSQGYLVLQAGNWPAPFGISLVADMLSALMIAIAAIINAGATCYALVDIDRDRQRHGFHIFQHMLLMGVAGCFLAGDLFNLYVWYEVMLMASFILLCLGGEKGQLQGGIKYVVLNLVASAFFLTALGILYGMIGTLNMADIALRLQNLGNPGISSILAMLFLVAFGIKAALFPFFAWLPDSYNAPPVAVTALFSGLQTKVGVYSLIRVFTLLFVQDISFTHELILLLAGLTMVTGVFGAVSKNNIRHILSFHIISQIGYMIMGLALFAPLALAGGIFFTIHNILAKTNLFLVGGVARRLRGTEELAGLGGLARTAPWLGILFLISALSLAGLPPLSGFWAKLFLIWSSFQEGRFLIGATALFVGILTLLSMSKIWTKAFWGKVPIDHSEGRPPQKKLDFPEAALLYIPIITLALLTLGIGFWPKPLFELAGQAASQLLDPGQYIQAVLGARP